MIILENETNIEPTETPNDQTEFLAELERLLHFEVSYSKDSPIFY